MDNMLELSNYIDRKYGSIYTAKGNGRSQIGGTRVTDFAKKILGNRILDLYLKYNALKILNTATIVPMAFILGKEHLQRVLNQSGGGDPIPSDIPILDHPLVGTYLKILGISTLDVTMGTLLPLGSLMIIHDLFTNHDADAPQSGGGPLVDNTVPPHMLQNLKSVAQGRGLSENTLVNRFPEFNSQLQLGCGSGSCGPNVYTSYRPVTSVSGHVNAFPSLGIRNSTATSLWQGDTGSYSRASVPSSMAGGGSSYEYITNPKNGKVHSIKSKQGQSVLNNYVKSLK